LPLQSQQIARQCARIEEAAVQCLVEGRAIARAQKVRALHVQQAAFDRVGDFELAIQKVAEQRQVASERKGHRFGAGASCDGYA
jgi:hypothetical protein